jgi:hypothetical protein
MNYNSIVINKVDNGFVVNTQKNVFGEQRPETTINVFTSFDDVLAFIGGSTQSPAIATA